MPTLAIVRAAQKSWPLDYCFFLLRCHRPLQHHQHAHSRYIIHMLMIFVALKTIATSQAWQPSDQARPDLILSRRIMVRELMKPRYSSRFRSDGSQQWRIEIALRGCNTRASPVHAHNFSSSAGGDPSFDPSRKSFLPRRTTSRIKPSIYSK